MTDTHEETCSRGNRAEHCCASYAVAMMRQADEHTAAELDRHVDYYERAAGDISQALEYVEDTGTEAAVALRATQRTMSSVATALRRRAAELRGEVPASRLLLAGMTPVPPEEE